MLVNQSQTGCSVLVDGNSAPIEVSGSIQLEGEGRIGLAAGFAYANTQQSVIFYEIKGG